MSSSGLVQREGYSRRGLNLSVCRLWSRSEGLAGRVTSPIKASFATSSGRTRTRKFRLFFPPSHFARVFVRLPMRPWPLNSLSSCNREDLLLCQGWGENDRGVSYTFGADVVQKFLNKHDMDLIARAHQVVGASLRFFFPNFI